MINDLLWVFKAHRNAYDRINELEHRIVEISTKAESRLADVEAWSARRVSDLEEQLARKPVPTLPDLAHELFQDQPYDGGKIPDDAWLTPGQNDR